MSEGCARDMEAPATLPFPAPSPRLKPEAHVVLAIPKADFDTMIDLQYFSPEQAHKAQACGEQSRFVTPSGGVFLYSTTPAPAERPARSARF